MFAYAQTQAAPAAATAENAEDDAEDNAKESTEEGRELVWPAFYADIQAGSAIVMDADTGQVLWGKDIHAKRYPASITKLLTALVVLDHCSMDEQVTFNASAVNNLESGAVTIGTVPGDTLSVKDCLYALLLKSANEVANALAEHVAGSQEAFAVMMNEKAVSLGCMDSDFRNPSGLTNSEHVTSAYDMALIGCACMNNEDFLFLESEPTRKLAGTQKYPDGLTVTIGHKMRVPGEEYYDARVIAGKTGYTSASGNTLVTMAEDHGRRVVAVVLKDKNPAHYTDTKALIDFGLDQFELLRPDRDSLLESKDVENTLVNKGLIPEGGGNTGAINRLSFSEMPKITVPVGATLEDVYFACDAELGIDAPEGSVASATLTCLDSIGPSFYVINERIETESENGEILVEGPDGKEGDGNGESAKGGLSMLAWVLIALLLTALIFAAYFFIRKRREEKRRQDRRRVRRERLERLDNMQREAEEIQNLRENRRRVSTEPVKTKEMQNRRRSRRAVVLEKETVSKDSVETEEL